MIDSRVEGAMIGLPAEHLARFLNNFKRRASEKRQGLKETEAKRMQAADLHHVVKIFQVSLMNYWLRERKGVV